MFSSKESINGISNVVINWSPSAFPLSIKSPLGSSEIDSMDKLLVSGNTEFGFIWEISVL